MKLEKYMDEEVLVKKSLNILIENLGPIETIRFLNIPKEKRIDSVKRHREWQKMLDKEEFFKEVFNDQI